MICSAAPRHFGSRFHFSVRDDYMRVKDAWWIMCYYVYNLSALVWLWIWERVPSARNNSQTRVRSQDLIRYDISSRHQQQLHFCSITSPFAIIFCAYIRTQQDWEIHNFLGTSLDHFLLSQFPNLYLTFMCFWPHLNNYVFWRCHIKHPLLCGTGHLNKRHGGTVCTCICFLPTAHVYSNIVPTSQKQIFRICSRYRARGVAIPIWNIAALQIFMLSRMFYTWYVGNFLACCFFFGRLIVLTLGILN